jgi:enolase
MIDLDGTPTNQVGANAILRISLAVAKAAANVSYRYTDMWEDFCKCCTSSYDEYH